MTARSLTRRRFGAVLATAAGVGFAGCSGSKDDEDGGKPGDDDEDPIEGVPTDGTDTEAGIPDPPGNESANGTDGDEDASTTASPDATGTGTEVGNETTTADATATGVDADENATN